MFQNWWITSRSRYFASPTPSVLPILLKLHWCFVHRLKIFMWFGYKTQTKWMDRGYLVGPTPTVLYRFFQSLTGVWFMVWKYACGLDIILRLFFVTNFGKLNLDIFSGIIYNKLNGKRIPYVRNSSYSFFPILSKLHWCFGHDQNICVWSGFILRLFLILFHKLNLAIFPALSITKWMDRGFIVGATPPTVYSDSFETSLVY